MKQFGMLTCPLRPRLPLPLHTFPLARPPPHPPARSIMLESFVATQKLSVQKALRKKFRRYLSAQVGWGVVVGGGGRHARASC